jgi:DNA-3-methyladenine glycosylase II
MTPHYWNDAKAHLSNTCPVMAKLIASYPEGSLVARGDAFYTLMRSIVGQQISVQSADAVWGRLAAKVKPMTAQKMLRVRDSTLRSVGLSSQKVVYCKELARFFTQAHITPEYFQSLSDKEAIDALVSIKGIGVWSAEMFLIFHLQRPDIFPLQDIGMIKALERYYMEGKKLTKEEIISRGEQFRPYRSVATWYLWRALDPVPVAY